MLQGKNWTVIVSRNKAKILRVVKDTFWKLQLLDEIKNPLGRVRTRELQTDRAGLSFPKMKGVGPHRTTNKTDTQEDAATQFVLKVCSVLAEKQYNKAFDGLIIAAEPHLMGILKKKMKSTLKTHVVKWVNKDLEKIPVKSLPDHLKLD